MKSADCPAFPCQLSGINAYGMTKREFFAAMALQGMLAATNEGDGWPSPRHIAERAFGYADAMLAQEEK